MHGIRILIACVLFSALLPAAANAQERKERFNLVLQGVPLPEALETLVRLTHVDLVYNTDLVSSASVYCVRQQATAEELLQCVLAGSDLEFVRSLSGAYVLIPSVRRAPAHGSLAGLIVDAESGAPLPQAHVFLAEAATGTATNDAGLFSIAPLVSGPYRLTVTYVGYQTTVDSVYITPGRQQRIELALRSAGVALPPVVVDGLEQRLPSQALGAESVRFDERLRTSGLMGLDVARGAATLPGVSVQRPLADLHIQGGSAGSHVVLLDGAPVRDPVSLGRHLSAFSPLALGRMTIHRAGFGAAEGSNITGQLAMVHDLSVAGAAEVRGSVDPISANARVATRFGRKGGVQGTILLAGRMSVWDLYREPYIDDLFRTWHALDPVIAARWLAEPVTPQSLQVLQQIPDVHFSDLHGAIRMRTSALQSTEASLYRARNQLGSTLAATNTPEAGRSSFLATHDHYDWNNWVAQARHNFLIGARSLLSVYGHGSWHLSRYAYGTGHEADYMPDPDRLQQEVDRLIDTASEHAVSDESNRITELTFGVRAHHSLTRHTGVLAGLEATNVASRFRVGGPFVGPLAYDIRTWHFGGFMEADVHVGVHTILKPGLRLTYLPAREEAYFEPRVSIRHDRAATGWGDVAVRMSGGVYRQFVNEFELTSSGSTAVVPFVYFWLPIDRTVAPPRSYHLAADALLMPGRHWTASVALYHKWNPRLLMLDYAWLAHMTGNYEGGSERLNIVQEDLVVGARGSAYGGEVRVRYESDAWAATARYALSMVNRRIPGRFDGSVQPVHWNIPHTIHGAFRTRLPAGFAFELDGRVHAGMRWGYREAYYDYLLERYGADVLAPLNLADPSAARLPTTITVDTGLSYRLSLGPAVAHLRLLVINALDRHEVYERNAYGTVGSVGSIGRTLPGRHVLLSVTVGS